MRANRTIPSSVLVGATLALAACAGGTTPQDAVREYAGAVASDNADRAWALTSPDERARQPRERFDADFEARVAAGDPYVDALRDASRSDAALTASLPYGDFEQVELVYEDGAWRIASGVGDFFSQATPRDTLRSFLRAVDAGDTDALLPLIPAEFRAQIGPGDLDAWLTARADTLAQTVALLRESVDAPIRESDDEARLRYGAHEMRFARESGKWVIVDFD